jgi:hypothetical protein
MKKSILTIGLFSLVMVLTFYYARKLIISLEMLQVKYEMDIIGGCQVKYEIIS